MKTGLILILIFFPATAFAQVPSQLQVYTVWNQFDATVQAFQMLGLIMSDARYDGLFFGIIVLGILIGGIAAFCTIYTGKNPFGSLIRWFGVVLIGITIYLAFIRPTTSITVYDEVLNQQQTIGGIPEGIVFLAGLSNTLETGFVEMIAMAGDPTSYRNDAGGLSFTIFEKLFSGGINMAGDTTETELHAYNSLKRYFQDCVFFELNRPGTPLDINAFNNTTDYLSILAQAQNPSVYTVYWDSANRSGQTLSCTDAWTRLNQVLQNMTDFSTPVNLFWNDKCGLAGVASPLTCRSKAQSVADHIFGASYSASLLFRQYFITQAMWDLFTTASPDLAVQALANRSAGNAMVGMGIMANHWIPIMRSVIFSIFIGLLPFLCLFIPTPLFPKVFSFLCGIFVFLTAWTVCDALVNSFIVDRAMDTFREIQVGQLGYTSMLLFSSAAQKALAMFGVARWSAVLVAGMFASLITRFGGLAMVHFAQGLAGVRQHGASAAESVASPSRWADNVKGLGEVYPSMAYANAGLSNVATKGKFRAESELHTAAGMASHYGGSATAAGKAMGGANVTQNMDRIAYKKAIDAYADAHQMSATGLQQAVQNFAVDSKGGSALALNNLADSLQVSPHEAMDFMKAVGMDREYGQAAGLSRAHANAVTENGYTGTLSDYVAMQAGIQSMKGFADAAAVEKYGKHYTGGTSGFLKDQAEFQTSQAASQMESIREYGATPGGVGEVLGNLSGLRNIIDSDVFENIGERGVWIKRAGEQYNELSNFILRQTANEIMTTGGISGDTRQMLDQLRNTPLAAAQLKAHQGSGVTMGVSEEDASHLAQWLNAHGANVNASDLAKGVVTMNLADSDGQLAPAMVVSNKGQKIGEYDLHTQETGYRGTSGDIDKSYGGDPGNYGGVNLLAIQDIQRFGNGVAVVKGIDYKGNQHEMTMLMNGEDTSKWAVSNDTMTSGPNYSRVNAIAASLNMTENDAVFQERPHAIAFTNQLASEMNKVISKSKGNEETRQSVNSWIARTGARFDSAGVGFLKGISRATGLSVDGSTHLEHASREIKSKSVRTERDAIAGVYREIALSELPDQQKRELFQEFTRHLLGDENLPELSPDRPGAEIAHFGRNSEDIKSWKGSPDYRPPIIPPSPYEDPNAPLMQYIHDNDPLQKFKDSIEINGSEKNSEKDKADKTR